MSDKGSHDLTLNEDQHDELEFADDEDQLQRRLALRPYALFIIFCAAGILILKSTLFN